MFTVGHAPVSLTCTLCWTSWCAAFCELDGFLSLLTLHCIMKRQMSGGFPVPLLNYEPDNERLAAFNRPSSEIQGIVPGKCLRAWTCIYRSMPAGVAQSRHAFVGGTVSTWGRWQIPINKRQKRHQKCRSSSHCSWGACRSDSRFPQLVV